MSKVFADVDAARTQADVKNAEPLADGKQRNPYKVYEVTIKGESVGYIIGQTPTAGLGSASAELGILVDHVVGPKIPPVTQLLNGLSEAELDAAQEQINKLRAARAAA